MHNSIHFSKSSFRNSKKVTTPKSLPIKNDQITVKNPKKMVKIQKKSEKFRKILLGFCFRKWRSVTVPDYSLCWTLTLNIFTWWRHTCDLASYMYIRPLTATYDVTVQLSCVTSQANKKKTNFGFCFRKWRWVMVPKCCQ